MLWLPTLLKTERHFSVLGTGSYGIVVITVLMLFETKGKSLK